MEGFHSHNVLCCGVFMGSSIEKVEDVVMRELVKGKVDN